MIARATEAAIAAGASEREAIAEFVLEFNIAAATFRGACERFKRLLDAYRENS
jgi:hypothetical protein